MRLPQIHRPIGLSRRNLIEGLDLPKKFIDEVRSIDDGFYFVWHPYRVLYDDVMNCYTGSLEDPRFSINERFGHEVWGWPLLDTNGDPIDENRWHLWRLHSHGWSHVIDVASRDPEHLSKIVSRLARAANLADMNRRERMNYLQDEQEEQLQKDQTQASDLWKETQKANSKLMRNVADNFSYGRTAPTNPTKDIITSYKGEVNRSKITRTITDKEGRLISPYDKES